MNVKIDEKMCVKVVNKTWGEESWVVNNKEAGYCNKYMRLDPGHQCSLHRHPRHETFIIESGMMILEVEGSLPELPSRQATWFRRYDPPAGSIMTSLYLLGRGDRAPIDTMTYHRFYGVGADPCIFIEVSQPHGDVEDERLEGELSR